MVGGILQAALYVGIDDISRQPDHEQAPGILIEDEFDGDSRVTTSDDRSKRMLSLFELRQPSLIHPKDELLARLVLLVPLD